MFLSLVVKAAGHHLHYDQDEWIYVITGEFNFEIGDKRFRLGAGESVFMPRKVPHVWACVGGKQGKIINMYQPAAQIEMFFREVGGYNGKPRIHEALSFEQLSRLFHDHGMDLLGPPLTGNWKVDEGGRVKRTV